MIKLYGTLFYGNEASEYAKANGYLDYRTLAKAFDCILSNDIIANTQEIGCWEQVSGFVDYFDEIEELQEKIDKLDIQIFHEEDEAKTEELQEKIDKLEEQKKELEDNESYTPEIYQYFIVSKFGAEILEEANEIVFYNEVLDMYVWGVTHYGTAWDYVLTDIKLNNREDI